MHILVSRTSERDPAGTTRRLPDTVSTSFQAASTLVYLSFAGVVLHSWIEREPSEDAIFARLLVDQPAPGSCTPSRLATMWLRHRVTAIPGTVISLAPRDGTLPAGGFCSARPGAVAARA